MEGAKELQVRISSLFNLDLDEIFRYGTETFGTKQAEIYENEIWQFIEQLSHTYNLFPECRYLVTKSRMYRWIILDAHKIIYRITENEVQVLRIIHAKCSIINIKSTRKIRFD